MYALNALREKATLLTLDLVHSQCIAVVVVVKDSGPIGWSCYYVFPFLALMAL